MFTFNVLDLSRRSVDGGKDCSAFATALRREKITIVAKMLALYFLPFSIFFCGVAGIYHFLCTAHKDKPENDRDVILSKVILAVGALLFPITFLLFGVVFVITSLKRLRAWWQANSVETDLCNLILLYAMRDVVCVQLMIYAEGYDVELKRINDFSQIITELVHAKQNFEECRKDSSVGFGSDDILSKCVAGYSGCLVELADIYQKIEKLEVVIDAQYVFLEQQTEQSYDRLRNKIYDIIITAGRFVQQLHAMDEIANCVGGKRANPASNICFVHAVPNEVVPLSKGEFLI